MKKPGKLFKKDLEHPKAEKKSSFNGDVRRPADEQGFSERRRANGVSVTHGSRPQSNVKPVTHARHPGAHAPMTRDLKVSQDPQVFVPALRRVPSQTPAPLTDRQKKMTRRPK